MSVLTSLIYAAAAVALFVLIVECCCRQQLKSWRESHHVITLPIANSSTYPTDTPYPVSPAPPSAPYPTTAPFLMPMPPPEPRAAVPPTCFVSVFPAPATTNTQHDETPPPSYEQVVAGDRGRVSRPS